MQGHYFDVRFDVEVNSQALHTARFVLPDGQALQLIDPQVVPQRKWAACTGHHSANRRPADAAPVLD